MEDSRQTTGRRLAVSSSIVRPTHRLLAGLLGKDQSVATGLLIGIIIWTLTRLGDAVTRSGSIEYAVKYSRATIANGTAGNKMENRLTHPSRDTAGGGPHAGRFAP